MHWIVQKLRTTLHNAKNWLLKYSSIQLIYSKIYHFITGLYIIPKDVRFIWLGSGLPENYKRNILTWLNFNQDYNIHLYIDSATLPLESMRANVLEMQQFCKQHGIHLHDIHNIAKYSNLTTSSCYNDWVNGKHKTYAFAADYLRVNILEEGGIYADIDTQCVKSLGTLINQTGMFVWGSNILSHEPVFIDNCLIASIAKNPILSKCMYFMQENYKHLMFQGKLPQRVIDRIMYTELEHDSDLVYKTMRFPNPVNDAEIGFTFGAGNMLNIISAEIKNQYGMEGIKASVFEVDDKILHAAERTWMGRNRTQRMGMILADDVESYQQQLLHQKMTPQLLALRG